MPKKHNQPPLRPLRPSIVLLEIAVRDYTIEDHWMNGGLSISVDSAMETEH